MNFKITILLFFAGISFFFSQSANLKIYYKYEYRTDSTNQNSLKDDIMVLHLVDKKSYFYSDLRQKGDSALRSDTEKGIDPMTMLANKNKYQNNKISYIVIKDFAINQIGFNDKILNNVYTYNESFPSINWKITDSADTVLGHNCRIAVGKFGNRVYKAWFAQDIPVSDGPFKFWGLPGLILKVEESKKNFSFTAISILKNRPLNLHFYEASILVTRKKYLEIKELSVKNFLQFININSDVKISPVNAMEKPQEKPYNPIELK